MEKRKNALSLFWSCCLFVVLMGCSNSEITNRVPGKYLLNGNLSDETDANGFAYYLDDGEAYVARGANTETSPVVPASVTLGGVVYPVTGVYHNGFAKSDITSIDLPLSIKTIDYQAFAESDDRCFAAVPYDRKIFGLLLLHLLKEDGFLKPFHHVREIRL